MMSEWKKIKRILVARLDNIGDIVMLSPALRSIKENVPWANVTLFASPAGASIADLLPEIDEVLAWRVVWQDVGGHMPFDPRKEYQLIDTLRKGCFDAVLIFTSFSQSPFGVAYASYLAGIPVRIGQSKEFCGSLLSLPVKPLPDETHQVERNLHLLTAIGFEVTGRDLRVSIPDGARRSVATKLVQRGLGQASYVVLHAGASCQARRYPAKRFAAVADALIGQLGLPVILTGAERERAVVEPIVNQMREYPVVLLGETTVSEWAALIDGARLVVTNHTGSLHLADACSTPSLILFSGTDLVSQWGPRHSVSRVLQQPTWCTPCYRFECPYALECLDISPGVVIANVKEVLDETDAEKTKRVEGVWEGI